MEHPMRTALVAAVLACAALRTAAEYGPAVQVVAPGQSIQAAIDQAPQGGTIYVLPGTYAEPANMTNALQISRGLRLIGLPTAELQVRLVNAGAQRNGIVAVPPEHTACMDCHTSLAPPFPRTPKAQDMRLSQGPTIFALEIRGITVQGFGNNGVFVRGVDGFQFADVHSVDNPNYGIFPVSSRNGSISHSSATGAHDSGIWIETSREITVSGNRLEGNVNGIEVSNSEDVVIEDNVVQGNTVGMALFLLPEIFDVQGFSRRITVRGNTIAANNKENTATPGSVLAGVPPGIGVLLLGVDESRVEGNTVTDHAMMGIGVANYCMVNVGTDFACSRDPAVTPAFVASSAASGNAVVGNVLLRNGLAVDPNSTFAFAAGDLSLLARERNGNCFQDNRYTSYYSRFGSLPSCSAAADR